MRGSIAFAPSLTGTSALGCTSCTTSRWPCFHSSSQRTTFMPPEVEPAQPPMNVDSIRITGSAPGQCVKSSVKKPEVVCIDTAWNSEQAEAHAPGSPSGRLSHSTAKYTHDAERQHATVGAELRIAEVVR